jgi:uncharacterized membrane-anchored protein YitT (DUF2179 family)
METASFTGFIKMIFEIILFFYVIKFLAKLFLPVLAKKVVQKAQENFEKHQSNVFNTNQNDQIINNPKSDKPRETKKVGEYVDFEEID